MFKGVEIFGIKDSWKSIDEAESSQQHRVFPKEKMGLDVLDQMDFADDGNNECNEVSEEELELQDVTEKKKMEKTSLKFPSQRNNWMKMKRLMSTSF